MNCAPVETLRRIVRHAARRMQRWPDLVSDGFGDCFPVFWLWYFPLAWVRRSPLIAVVLLVALLLSGCWCKVAIRAEKVAEGLVQRWSAITRNACVPDPDGDLCREAGEHLTRALAALIAAQTAAAVCGSEDPAGFTLARVEPDVDLDALKKELDRLEKAAEEWEKP